tara:strand:+ start:29 stop:292 length:264 start_codon:yes stop_codon:yes gene_type:complete
MKWFIVVLFMQTANAPISADREIYVFTDPTFESQLQCESDVVDPAVYPALVQKLLLEYKYPRKIQNVFCIEQKELEELIGRLTAKQV